MSRIIAVPTRWYFPALLLALATGLGISTPPASATQTWASWTKWPEPIFTGQSIASDPVLIDDGAFYRMFYTFFIVPDQGFDEDLVQAAICQANSDDGIAWQEVPAEGTTRGLVMSRREDQWDLDLEGAFAIKWNGDYLLYYSSYRHQGNPAIGYPASLAVARSTDGLHFERVSSDPIIEPTPGWLDNDAV